MVDILKIRPNVPRTEEIYCEYDVEDTAEYAAAMLAASIHGKYGAEKSNTLRKWRADIISFE